MDDIEADETALMRLYAALAKVKLMGGAGVLLPGHAEEAEEELNIAQECQNHLLESITALGQHITDERKRLSRDKATFRKFGR